MLVGLWCSRKMGSNFVRDYNILMPLDYLCSSSLGLNCCSLVLPRGLSLQIVLELANVIWKNVFRLTSVFLRLF